MTLTIHQPEFMPWLGYFHKMAVADRYVLLDCVQYEKNYFQNRNKIRSQSAEGWSWITVPVLQKDKSQQLISQVELNSQDRRWQSKNWKTIEQSYRKAPFFSEYADNFRSILLDAEFTKLVELNLALIALFREILGISTPMSLASELSPDSTGSELLADTCSRHGAVTYLSGPHGRDYLDTALFEERSISIDYHEFKHPTYEQVHGQFVPYMSALDLVMNHGPNSARILMEQSE